MIDPSLLFLFLLGRLVDFVLGHQGGQQFLRNQLRSSCIDTEVLLWK